VGWRGELEIKVLTFLLWVLVCSHASALFGLKYDNPNQSHSQSSGFLGSAREALGTFVFDLYHLVCHA
jgi:hypothetical protein